MSEVPLYTISIDRIAIRLPFDPFLVRACVPVPAGVHFDDHEKQRPPQGPA